MERVHIIMSGRVVGVSFRYFIEENARKLGVNGWVRNTNDSKVEAVFEGDENSVDKLIELCRKGPRAAMVDNVDVKEEKYVGEFNNFEIVH